MQERLPDCPFGGGDICPMYYARMDPDQKSCASLRHADGGIRPVCVALDPEDIEALIQVARAEDGEEEEHGEAETDEEFMARLYRQQTDPVALVEANRI